jgi:photosystem II stability/assembly factor-like uncharacterized protein
MKTNQFLIVTIALLLSFSTAPLMAQKWVGSSASANLLPDGYVVFGIKVVDKNVIWATASDANVVPPVPSNHLIKILRTTNGGQTWRVIDVTAAMGRISFDIQAFDSTTAWITTQDYGSGLGRALFKTTNGGQTWVRKLAHDVGGVYLRFLDRNNGVCFNTGLFAYTSDGGDNWTIDSTSALFRRNEFNILFTATNAFANRGDTLWVGTNAGRIFRSTDKGHHWAPYSTGIPASWAITSLAFKDARNGMIAATDTVDYNYTGLAKTSDGGATWQVLSTLTLPSDFINAPIITAVPNKATSTYMLGVEDYATGVAKSYFTIDNGDSWSSSTKDINSHGATEFLSPEVGWVGNGYVDNATDPTTMFKWEGSNSLASQVLPPWVKQNVPILDASIYYLLATDKNTLWTYTRDNVPDSAHIKKAEFLRTGDGGKTYKKGTLYDNAADYFYHIQPFDGKTAHLISAKNDGTFAFQRTVDSGATWQNMPMQPRTFPDVVYFWDTNNGIFVADPDSLGLVIMYTTNGGNTYTRVPQTNVPPIDAANEFALIGEYQVVGNTIFISITNFNTNQFSVWRSIDRGRNWTAGAWFETGTAPGFTARYAFSDANNGLLLRGIHNTSQKPLYTEDGGKTWHESGNLPSYTSWAIDKVPNTQNFMAFFQDTMRGMLYSALTNDLGKTWHSKKDVISYQLNADFTPFGFPPFVDNHLSIVSNNSAWARFTDSDLYRYDSTTPIVAEKPDLELTLTADNNGLPLWGYVKFTLTMTNRGISRATGIKANWLPPYKRTNNGGEAFANVGAYSSKGNYNWWTGDWNVNELAAGETATATFHLFVVKNTANVTQTAQITACNESDLDSAPNNMTVTSSEDDEARFTSAARPAIIDNPNPKSTPSVSALKVSPNPAKDKAFVVVNDKTEAEWTVKIVNNTGQVVYTQTGQNSQLVEVNTEGLPNGLYVVEFKNGLEKKVEKLMVQH